MFRAMTYNILNGGVDDDGTNRLPAVHEVVASCRPDVLAVQEANEFDLRAGVRLFAFERAVGMRGLLAASPSGFHGVTFLRHPLQPTSHRVHPVITQSVSEVVFTGAGATPITVCGVHYDPIASSLRITGALYSLNAPPAIVMGDFNNCRADDGDDTFGRFSPRHRARQLGERIDDRLFHALEAAGFVDLYRKFHPDRPGYTTAAAGGLRIDFIFATADLAERATSCEVLDDDSLSGVSDHFPVIADFDL